MNRCAYARSQAGFEGALILHGRGVAIDIETFYWRSVHALDDDYEEVRTQALHLIWYANGEPSPSWQQLWLTPTRPPTSGY